MGVQFPPATLFKRDAHTMHIGRTLYILVSIISALICHGEPIVVQERCIEEISTTKEVRYLRVVVKSLYKEHVTVEHADGIALIPLSELNAVNLELLIPGYAKRKMEAEVTMRNAEADREMVRQIKERESQERVEDESVGTSSVATSSFGPMTGSSAPRMRGVFVNSYIRKDGTSVSAHTRSYADGFKANNRSYSRGSRR